MNTLSIKPWLAKILNCLDGIGARAHSHHSWRWEGCRVSLCWFQLQWRTKLDGLHLDMEEHSLFVDCLSGQFKVFCRFCWLPFHQAAIRFWRQLQSKCDNSRRRNLFEWHSWRRELQLLYPWHWAVHWFKFCQCACMGHFRCKCWVVLACQHRRLSPWIWWWWSTKWWNKCYSYR